MLELELTLEQARLPGLPELEPTLELEPMLEPWRMLELEPTLAP